MFNKASILHRILIVAAGGVVNIVFALIVFFILSLFYRLEVEYSLWDKIVFAFRNTIGFILSMVESLKLLFTGQIGLDQMTGPVGISEIVVNTNGLFNFIHLLCLVSLSLGVTNLLPFPALDGGRIVLLIIEGIRGKALSEEIEMKIQSMGFILLIMIAFYVTYQDILRLF